MAALVTTIRLSSLLAGLGSVVFALPLVATWQAGVPPSVRGLSAALLAATLVRPRWGLIALAFLLPLAPYISALTAAPVGRVAVAEILLAPFLFGASLRIAAGMRGPAVRLAGPALVFGCIVAVDGVVGLAARQQVTTWPLDFVRDLWRHLSTGYFGDQGDFAIFHEMLWWIEGATLAVLTERVLRTGSRGWGAVLLAGAAGVAATSWIRLYEISARRPEAWAAAMDFVMNERIQTLFRDVNAAGSLYALLFVPAAWLAFRGTRPAGEPGSWLARIAYGGAAIVVGLALYMTHSRAAYAGAAVALVALWLASRRISRTVVAAAALAGVVLLVLVVRGPASSVQVSSGQSMVLRWDMGRIALQIAAHDPVFGVGLGGFRNASRAYITPELEARFPATVNGENAHNNFLQILAELGIVGLAAFLWLLVPAVRAWVDARRAGPISALQAGLTGGVIALLVSCLAGHPFLMADVLWVFFLMHGASIGVGPAPEPGAAASRRVALGLALLVIALAPVRLWQLRHTEIDTRAIGAGPVTRVDSDIPYRRIGARSVWFVPKATRLAVLPLRVTRESPATCRVGVSLDGREINVVAVTRRDWFPLRVVLDPAEATSGSRRLELRLDDEACVGMVAEPVYR